MAWNFAFTKSGKTPRVSAAGTRAGHTSAVIQSDTSTTSVCDELWGDDDSDDDALLLTLFIDIPDTLNETSNQTFTRSVNDDVVSTSFDVDNVLCGRLIIDDNTDSHTGDTRNSAKRTRDDLADSGDVMSEERHNTKRQKTTSGACSGRKQNNAISRCSQCLIRTATVSHPASDCLHILFCDVCIPAYTKCPIRQRGTPIRTRQTDTGSTVIGANTNLHNDTSSVDSSDSSTASAMSDELIRRQPIPETHPLLRLRFFFCGASLSVVDAAEMIESPAITQL